MCLQDNFIKNLKFVHLFSEKYQLFNGWCQPRWFNYYFMIIGVGVFGVLHAGRLNVIPRSHVEESQCEFVKSVSMNGMPAIRDGMLAI